MGGPVSWLNELISSPLFRKATGSLASTAFAFYGVHDGTGARAQANRQLTALPFLAQEHQAMH